MATSGRRSSTSTTATSSSCRCRSPTPKIPTTSAASATTARSLSSEGAGPPGPDPDRRAGAAARQRPQDQGDLVHGRCGRGPAERLAPPEHRPGDAEQPGAQRPGAGDPRVGGRLRGQPQGSCGPGAARLPRGQQLRAALHQPLRRGGQQAAAVRHPERLRHPLGRMARRQADLGHSGPAAAPQELRQAHPGHRGVLRQLHPGQPLELHRRPHRCAGQPAVPGPDHHPAERHSRFGHQERIPELPVELLQRVRVRPRS